MDQYENCTLSVSVDKEQCWSLMGKTASVILPVPLPYDLCLSSPLEPYIAIPEQYWKVHANL